MLGDFILQGAWMSANKLKSHAVRTIHVGVYMIPFGLFCYIRQMYFGLSDARCLGFMVTLFVLHWLTDSKRFCTGNPWPAKPIMVDQTLHVLQLAVCGSLFL